MSKPITDTSPQKPGNLDRNNQYKPHSHIQWLGKSRLFVPSTLLKFPELIPLIVIGSSVPAFALYTIYHNLANNPGVRVAHKRNQYIGPHEHISPHQSSKFYNSQPDIYKPNPELEAVKKDLRDATPDE